MSFVQRKQRPVDISKENGGGKRLDTPMVTGAPKVVPSRYRQTPQSLLRSSSSSNPGSGLVTAAAKLLQEATATPVNPCDDGSVVSRKPSKGSTSHGIDGCSTESSSCPNSPVCAQRVNGGTRLHQQQLADVLQSKSCKIPFRPDTPTVTGGGRIIPSRYKLTPQPIHRPSPANNRGGPLSAADKLLSEATATPVNPCSPSRDDDGAILSRKLPNILTSHDPDSRASSTTAAQGNSGPNSPVCIQSNKTRALSSMRSSMPEADRCLTERNRDNNSSRTVDDCTSYKPASSTCARSLHLPTASSENSSSWLSFKVGSSLCLPPHPASKKLGPEARKTKKGFIDQEDVHSLKMLYNRHLQWRYANAKAEASMHSQRQNCERRLHSFARQLSDLRESVSQKRAELEALRRIKILSAVLESQLPCLEEWANLEEDYTTSLSGTTDALSNCATRLPISGEVRVDVRELGQALNSSTKVMETISTDIQNFMTKAEETAGLVSELAKVSGGERALVEECGDLLSNTYTTQVTEMSLRGHMMQMNRNNNLKQQL